MIAKAAVNAYRPGSNSWRALRAEDEVLLHVIDTSADADADNNAGFEPAEPDDPVPFTLADDWLEWAHQQYGREVPGKLGMRPPWVLRAPAV